MDVPISADNSRHNHGQFNRLLFSRRKQQRSRVNKNSQLGEFFLKNLENAPLAGVRCRISSLYVYNNLGADQNDTYVYGRADQWDGKTIWNSLPEQTRQQLLTLKCDNYLTA